jgi:large subunit ribosomal protein L20
MRVKRGFQARRRRKKVMERASGFYSAGSRVLQVAQSLTDRANAYAYRDRKVRKREFRKLWTQRINAAARINGTTYSRLMGAINKSDLALDRKVLADMAVNDPVGFKNVVEQVLN